MLLVVESCIGISNNDGTSEEVSILGHVISREDIGVDPSGVEVVLKWEIPRLAIEIHVRNYLNHDLELAIAVLALKIWRHYLYGSKFESTPSADDASDNDVLFKHLVRTLFCFIVGVSALGAFHAPPPTFSIVVLWSFSGKRGAKKDKAKGHVYSNCTNRLLETVSFLLKVVDEARNGNEDANEADKLDEGGGDLESDREGDASFAKLMLLS
ncbi:hypothetical protein Fmac_002098 [Flemingia macrophylla]|uniref:Uncharacterized protein n=1 Tax=Flemingia macrophylla TaxID=520843 RepID=A0ABD1NJR7_9FABA